MPAAEKANDGSPLLSVSRSVSSFASSSTCRKGKSIAMENREKITERILNRIFRNA
jgi:hypothetical protein